MDFGQKIKKICELEGIKLKKFSELCNISYNSIAAYSSGKRTPSWDNINQIANTPEFKDYKQFILSPDSDDPELGAKIDEATAKQKTALDWFEETTKKTGLEQQALIEKFNEILKRQGDLDDQPEDNV